MGTHDHQLISLSDIMQKYYTVAMCKRKYNPVWYNPQLCEIYNFSVTAIHDFHWYCLLHLEWLQCTQPTIFAQRDATLTTR